MRLVPGGSLTNRNYKLKGRAMATSNDAILAGIQRQGISHEIDAYRLAVHNSAQYTSQVRYYYLAALSLDHEVIS